MPAPPPKFLGALELPEGEDEGPPDGMSLEAAMDRLVRASYDLRTKSFEIPQARADVLTASLRANPLVFGTATSIPYTPYSPQRPGEVNFSTTVIYPFDVSHKRRARTIVAAQAERVIEAQYQDAVRVDLDRLNNAFLDVIAARETVRYATASRDGLRQVFRLADQQLQNQQLAQIEVDRIGIQVDSSEIGVEQAHVALREARHALGLLLAMTIEQAEQIEVRGTLHDTAPQPPAEDDLIALANGSRPDLAAFRMGVQRARSDVQLAEAEKTSDVFLLYSPWELRNNSATGGQNAQSWSLAAFGSVPLFNRNQGNIRRAQLNVSQTRTELFGLEQQVGQEVRRAEPNTRPAGRSSSGWSERCCRDRAACGMEPCATWPRARRACWISSRHSASTTTWCSSTATRWCAHRRSMLRLNTAVGMRILP